MSRRRFAVSHLGPALVGPLVLMALTGVAAGVPYAVISGNGGQGWRVLASAVLFVPATWVLVGAAMALIGLLKRFTTAAWALLAGFAVLGEIGPLLKLPTAVLKVLPYAKRAEPARRHRHLDAADRAAGCCRCPDRGRPGDI